MEVHSTSDRLGAYLITPSSAALVAGKTANSECQLVLTEPQDLGEVVGGQDLEEEVESSSVDGFSKRLLRLRRLLVPCLREGAEAELERLEVDAESEESEAGIWMGERREAGAG